MCVAGDFLSILVLIAIKFIGVLIVALVAGFLLLILHEACKDIALRFTRRGYSSGDFLRDMQMQGVPVEVGRRILAQCESRMPVRYPLMPEDPLSHAMRLVYEDELIEDLHRILSEQFHVFATDGELLELSDVAGLGKLIARKLEALSSGVQERTNEQEGAPLDP